MTEAKDMVDQYVTALSDNGSNSIPMATTDPVEVIRSQLTENTGRHMLDSGSAYGRHWEENQNSPPWEKPAWTVHDGWVSHNVYNWMEREYDRDPTAVALEIGLYAYGYHGSGSGDSWLTCMKDFAELTAEPYIAMDELQDAGLPRELAEQAAYATVDGSGDPVFSFNTYNGEWHSLSQDLQGVSFGGPYADYAMIQVHGGCDIRGGYTPPRVYNVWSAPLPSELSYYCDDCGWSEAESCLGYDNEHLVYLDGVVDWPELEEALEEKGYEAHEDAMEYALERAWDNDHVEGAVFDLCGDGELGIVQF